MHAAQMYESLESSQAAQPSTDLRVYLEQCLTSSSRIIAPYWPIDTFIATNSFQHLEDMPFQEALSFAQALRGNQGFLPLAAYHTFYQQGRITEKDLFDSITESLHDNALPLELTSGGQVILTRLFYKHWLLTPIEHAQVQRQYPMLWSDVYRHATTFFASKEETDFPIKPVKTVGERYFVGKGKKSITDLVNTRLITWCAAFLGDEQAAWPIPDHELGLFACWKSLARHDPSFLFTSLRSVYRQNLALLPDDAHEALLHLLQHLKIPQVSWSTYLARHLGQLPGWASIIRWRAEHPEVPVQQQYPVSLVDYLALRLFYESLYLQSPSLHMQTSPSDDEERDQGILEIIARVTHLLATCPELATAGTTLSDDAYMTLFMLARDCHHARQQVLWQHAYELHYQAQMLRTLSTPDVAPVPSQTPRVQALFCIDVRSEGLRRQLEARGAYETYGVAGFFGIPVRYQPWESERTTALCPALITPKLLVKEVPVDFEGATDKRRPSLHVFFAHYHQITHALKEQVLTPFIFIETVGLLALFLLIGQTFLPTQWVKVLHALQRCFFPSIPTVLQFADSADSPAMTIEQQAVAMGTLLRSIGLIRHFARLILLCGHGSTSENNPYASSLDCGACGGNHGRINALLAVSMLNNPQVRVQLAAQGIHIPATTFFLAGEHNTTTDQVVFFQEEALPASHQEEFAQLKVDIVLAAQSHAYERSQFLPNAYPQAVSLPQALQQLAYNWAQMRPEWGLARNAAFICGRRSLIARRDLEGRAFLHSYDYREDEDATLLEGILTAPLVVAEWINMQYYVSTVDNARLGSGNKLLHTVVGHIGVMQGRQSDLLPGLPRQSVMIGEQFFHEPMRLLAIVEAPLTTIDSIVQRQTHLRQLIHNQWITLVACEPVTQTFYRYTHHGDWQPAFVPEISL